MTMLLHFEEPPQPSPSTLSFRRRMRRWLPCAACLFLLVASTRGLRAWQVESRGIEAQSPAGTQRPSATPGVEPILRAHRAHPGNSGAITEARHKKSYKLSVPATSTTPWLDTGIDVTEGDVLSIAASGSVDTFDGRKANPDGLPRSWKDLLRQFPASSLLTGSLIGRVGDREASVPFQLGSQATVTLPSSGRLFLGINTSADLTPDGKYEVTLNFKPAALTPALKGEPERALGAVLPDVSTVISPVSFTDFPRRVADQEGRPGDMVNFALLGTSGQIRAAFAAAGWTPVDSSVQDAVVHGVLSTLNHEPYTAVPMSMLYLFGRPQDLSFARGDPLKVAAERHHLRIWKTSKEIEGVPLWIGSATHDIGFELDQRNGDVTHKIDPSIDLERDFLLHSFEAAGDLSSAAYITPHNPLSSGFTATGGEFHTDGRILALALKEATPATEKKKSLP